MVRRKPGPKALLSNPRPVEAEVIDEAGREVPYLIQHVSAFDVDEDERLLRSYFVKRRTSLIAKPKEAPDVAVPRCKYAFGRDYHAYHAYPGSFAVATASGSGDRSFGVVAVVTSQAEEILLTKGLGVALRCAALPLGIRGSTQASLQGPRTLSPQSGHVLTHKSRLRANAARTEDILTLPPGSIIPMKEAQIVKSPAPVASVAHGGTQDHLLTLPEVARRLACSPGLVRRLDARGVLPRVQLGRSVRYRASDVARLVTEGVSDGPSRAA